VIYFTKRNEDMTQNANSFKPVTFLSLDNSNQGKKATSAASFGVA